MWFSFSDEVSAFSVAVTFSSGTTLRLTMLMRSRLWRKSALSWFRAFSDTAASLIDFSHLSTSSFALASSKSASFHQSLLRSLQCPCGERTSAPPAASPSCAPPVPACCSRRRPPACAPAPASPPSADSECAAAFAQRARGAQHACSPVAGASTMHLRLQSHLLQQRLRLRVGALRVGDESRLAHGRQTHAEVVCEEEF